MNVNALRAHGLEREHINSKSNCAAILDFGAQYGKVIDRRIRAASVESVMLPCDTPAKDLVGFGGIILSGSGAFVTGEDAPKYDPEIFNLGIPMLGDCYGMQVMARHFGGRVGPAERREDGPCQITITSQSPLFQGLESDQQVLMSHGDSILMLPPGFSSIATSDGLIAAMADPDRNMWAVQFHPEVDITEHGKEILNNFLFNIAGLKGDYTVANRRDLAVAEIRKRAEGRKVLTLVSGGVDSTVNAALLNEAIGAENVIAYHVDTGFMREGESAQVKKALEDLGLELLVVDAANEFFRAVKGQIDPEYKRKIIGNIFIQLVEELMSGMGYDEEQILLAQGTLRPDLIESASRVASGNAQTIKTHHNDSPAARRMRDAGRVIEPLSELHKDEVRELGLQLGLPDSVVYRQPFPGPGLAIRILCAGQSSDIDSAYQETQRKLNQFGSNDIQVSLLPVKTVGVQGDGRSYKNVVTLSGANDWQKLLQLAREIPKHVTTVNRVTYAFGDRINNLITDITPTLLTQEVVEQLREADAIVNEILAREGLLTKLSQVPVISIPVGFGTVGNRSIVLRPFMTNDFMTGLPALPGKDIPEKVVLEIVNRVLAEVNGISRVLYDLTSKPPGTTEWE